LFGSGGACSWLISGLKREGMILSGILDDSASLDDNLNNKKLNEFCIFSPKSKNFTNEIKSKSIVIMGILNPLIDTDLIKKRLIDDGWKNVVDFGKWTEEQYIKYQKCFSPISSDRWENKNFELNSVRKLLFDDQSVKIFDAFLKFVKEGKDQFPPIFSNPYFPSDIPKLNSPLRMIDCGAFTGDTISEAKSLGYNIELVHAFEPDLFNYKNLCKNSEKYGNVNCWPCGVSNKTKLIKFYNQNDMGSFISDTGDQIIQCVSIDDCLSNCHINFIKMDIEGSELDALIGGQNLIKKYLPRLAISIYHKTNDIWEIPLFLYKIYGNNARYYLRNHSRIIADTIFYVIPKHQI
jgi:FkbM family methyltransferase